MNQKGTTIQSINKINNNKKSKRLEREIKRQKYKMDAQEMMKDVLRLMMMMVIMTCLT